MSNAPRVTIEQVEAAIKGETYTVLPDGRTTICQLTLDNGFTVDGHSACVSIENFNAELGNKYSREEAVKKVWNHLGFRLADKLAAKPSSNFEERLRDEAKELNLKIDSLHSFLGSKNAGHVSQTQFGLLTEQLSHMQAYANVLGLRITHLDLMAQSSRAI